jgi:nucleoside-diphosphate-sugar epimerase
MRVDLTEYGRRTRPCRGWTPSSTWPRFRLPASPRNTVTFRNNVLSSYNVFAAARMRTASATWCGRSSETLSRPPAGHPPSTFRSTRTTRPARKRYALGKLVDETIAAQFCRWDPSLKMIGLRFSNVMEPADYARFPSFDADPALRRWNLWGYIDARDGAQAVRKALVYQGPGWRSSSSPTPTR